MKTGFFATKRTAPPRAAAPPRRRPARALLWALLLTTVAGCAPAIYNVNMRYQPTREIAPTVTDGRKFSMTVATFIDRRKLDDTLLLGRVIRFDGSSVPILPRESRPAEGVARALREVLGKSGYGVSPEKAAWDLDEGSIRPDWGRILIGGVIEELDITCLDAIPRKRYNATARVTLHFADVQKRRLFYRVTSESSNRLDHILFSEETLERQLNEVLSEALERAIARPETLQQIRKAMQQ